MIKNNKITIPYATCLFAGFIVFFIAVTITSVFGKENKFVNGEKMKLSESIKLPEPKLSGKTSVEEALSKRRSARDYTKNFLHIKDISQLLWSAQGITNKRGDRTAPSAGALYPLEIYVAVGDVKVLKSGLYHYDPEKHSLKLQAEGDLRAKLAGVSLHQNSIEKAPAVIIISAVYERTRRKYGERGNRYVHMEAGCAAENIYLQCESLGLATVFIGAFEDAKVKKVLGIQEEPLAIMPVGKR